VEAAQRFTEALNGGEALGLIREMNLNPTGPGVEPFLRALQASTDAAQKEASSTSSAEPMETDGAEKPKEDKMEE